MLSRIWEETRLELASKYNVNNVEMPRIKGIVLSYKRFRKALNRLLSSPQIEDTSEVEWGQKTPDPSAFTFFADTDQTWIIVKCSGYGDSLQADLRHELLHLWEAQLELKWGRLDRMEK